MGRAGTPGTEPCPLTELACVCVCAHGHPCVSEVRLMSLSHSYPRRSQALCGGLEEPEGETLSDPFLSSSRPSLSLSVCEPGLPGGW